MNSRLPRSLAVMYLDWRGEWRLPPLNGIASAPLLLEDGTINSSQGYDRATGMWCENVPDVAGLVPERPTREEAAAAQLLIRETFKTFCFADAETIQLTAGGVATVDTSKRPGRDEFCVPCCVVDRGLPAEPASCARGSVAGSTHIRCRRRQGSACALHLHHCLRA